MRLTPSRHSPQRYYVRRFVTVVDDQGLHRHDCSETDCTIRALGRRFQLASMPLTFTGAAHPPVIEMQTDDLRDGAAITAVVRTDDLFSIELCSTRDGSHRCRTLRSGQGSPGAPPLRLQVPIVAVNGDTDCRSGPDVCFLRFEDALQRIDLPARFVPDSALLAPIRHTIDDAGPHQVGDTVTLTVNRTAGYLDLDTEWCYMDGDVGVDITCRPLPLQLLTTTSTSSTYQMLLVRRYIRGENLPTFDCAGTSDCGVRLHLSDIEDTLQFDHRVNLRS